MFAVYDGHGGKEVAKYTAQKLPEFIQQTEAYKNGDYVEALKEAFLKFDATLKEPEVVAILKEIAGLKDESEKDNESENDNENDDDEENLGNLKEEAQMPIEEVMAKYASSGVAANPSLFMLKKEDKKKTTPLSPFLRGKQSECKETLVCSIISSNKSECSSSRSNSNCNEADFEVSSTSSGYVIQRKSLSEKYGKGPEKTIVDVTSNGTDEVAVSSNECKNVEEEEAAGSSSSKSGEAASEGDIETKKDEGPTELPDSSGDSNKTDPNTAPLVNGNGTHADDLQAKVEDAISSSIENGPVPPSKGKGKALVKKQPKTPEKKEAESPLQLFKKFVHSGTSRSRSRSLQRSTSDVILLAETTDDMSDSDSDDVTFHGPDSTSDDEDVAGEEEVEDDDEEEDEDEEDSEEFDEEEAEDEDDNFTMRLTDRVSVSSPGLHFR